MGFFLLKKEKGPSKKNMKKHIFNKCYVRLLYFEILIIFNFYYYFFKFFLIY